ncbi:MAG: vanadium-dependent haloperoxidase [Romboutsia sp.]
MTCTNYCANKSSDSLNNFSYLNNWSQIPYPNENKVFHGIDNTAGSWPLYYIKRNSDNTFSKIDGSHISFEIINPCNINYHDELIEVQEVQLNLTYCQENMATFWGTGVPVQQWTPIFLTLINTYSVTPPKSARILSCLQNVINDAFIITWNFKYSWDYPRPCQLNRNLDTFLSTPKFPTYPSGHSVVSGAIEVVLSYFFPKEASKIHTLAEDASISRLYGGIHFRSDLSQGLRLGRQIGAIAVEYLKTQCDEDSCVVDVSYNIFKDAPIMPNYC